MSKTILNADGDPLDASYLLEQTPKGFDLYFESSGGRPPRNRDYNEALGLVLERLARVRAKIQRVEVVSKKTEELPVRERTVSPQGYPQKIQLTSAIDTEDLRKKLCTAASKVASNSKSGSGNPQRRLLITLGFDKKRGPTLARLNQCIHRGPWFDATPTQSASAERSPHSPQWGTARGGQGHELDVKIRLAVEEYAMKQAELYYQDRGWKTQRRQTEQLGYDIECTKGGEHLAVEVKGTRTPGESLFLTNNEVVQAHAHSSKAVLFVVAKIRVMQGKRGPECSRGEVSVYEQWDPKSAGQLKVKSYTYKPPKKASEAYNID